MLYLFLVFHGLGFSGSMFFRVQVFQGPGFSGSGSRVRVQGSGPGFRSGQIVVQFSMQSKRWSLKSLIAFLSIFSDQVLGE